MGNKTSQVIAASNAAAALSMADSTVQEGRATIAFPAPAIQVAIPVPLGINKLYALRIEVFANTSGGDTSVARTEGAVQRDNVNSMGASNPLSDGAGYLPPLVLGFSPSGVTFELPAADGPGESRQYAWRWVLSPGYQCPFVIPAG